MKNVSLDFALSVVTLAGIRGMKRRIIHHVYPTRNMFQNINPSQNLAENIRPQAYFNYLPRFFSEELFFLPFR